MVTEHIIWINLSRRFLAVWYVIFMNIIRIWHGFIQRIIFWERNMNFCRQSVVRFDKKYTNEIMRDIYRTAEKMVMGEIS